MSVNKVIIVGYLGRDPDKRYMPNGNPVTTIAVATSEKWKDKDSGEIKENTEWHQIVFFGRTADVAAEYLGKGSRVYVEGKLRTEKYTDKNGIERYTTKILAEKLDFIDRRPDAQQQGTRASSNYGANDYSAAKGKRDYSPSQQQQYDDGDIPF